MSMEIETTQSISGLLNSFSFVFINLTMGWGKLESIKYSMPIFLSHNILDTFLGKYWQNDLPMFLHHMGAIIVGFYVLSIRSFDEEEYNFSYWLAMAEISSIFNSLRWFYRNTSWQEGLDLLFGVSFLIIRPLSVIKSFYPAYTMKNWALTIPIWSIYTLLNFYWCCCLVLYSKRVKNAFIQKFKLLES